MSKVQLRRVFHVPLEKVLQYFGNHELYDECHKREDATYTVVSHEGSEIVVEVAQVIKGKTIVFQNRTVYQLPHRIELETLSGPAKGSRQVVVFEKVPEGTRVTYTSDFRLDFGGVAGRAIRLISGKAMKKMMEESLEEGAEIDRKYLEGSAGPGG